VKLIVNFIKLVRVMKSVIDLASMIYLQKSQQKCTEHRIAHVYGCQMWSDDLGEEHTSNIYTYVSNVN
jgi:hypothetical protein